MTNKRTRRGGPLAAAAAVGLAMAMVLPAAHAADRSTASGYAAGAERVAVEALMTDAGVSRAEAVRHLAVQRANKALAAELVGRLGPRGAGYFLDPSTGSPVVNVLDEAAAERVRAAGATARVVRYSSIQLRATKSTLDKLAGVPNSAWGIDPSTDQVVVTISDAAPRDDAARLVSAVAPFGDQVRLQRTSGPITETLLDGDEISTGSIICSAGFNVNKDGRNYVVTAGHCTRRLPTWQGIGPSVKSDFPETDYGLIRNDSAEAPGEVNLYDGSSQQLTSAGDASVGEHVCKSGRTTQVTCGTVKALDQTVHYADGNSVSGLIQTSVHCDHGDSGGPLFDGDTALGTVSGGNFLTTYFQPVTAALDAYGVSLND
jgi:streptogrisin D